MDIAFVAGATGYTGRAVVTSLAERQVRTIAHVRPDSPRLEHWRERFGEIGIEIDSSPWEPEAMRAALARIEPDTIFSLLGTTHARARRAPGSGESHESVDYGLTAMLIDAARALSDPPRIVYLSAIGAGARRGGYLRARWKAEKALEESGLPHVIARPSFITGPDRDEPRPGERTAAAFLNGVAAVAGAFGARKTRGRLRSVTGAELGRALVAAAADPDAHGRILDGAALRAYL